MATRTGLGWRALICGALALSAGWALTPAALAQPLATQSLAEKPPLTWILSDFPPFIVTDGPSLPGEGFIDFTLRYLIERMPEYQHRYEVAGIARSIGLMEQGAAVCHPALLRTAEREKIAAFSGPVHFVLSHMVVARRDRLERLSRHLNDAGQVELPQMLADPTLTTSLTEKRVFSPAIDKALAEAGPSRNRPTIGVRFDSPFLQLDAGWIDYIFAYPVEPGWYRKSGRISRDADLVYLPVAGSEDYVLGGVACTRGEWGEAVIRRINAAVAAAGPRPPWINREKELSDAGAAQRLEEAFQRVAPFGR
mgnify:CR=1 FL=1